MMSLKNGYINEWEAGEENRITVYKPIIFGKNLVPVVRGSAYIQVITI